MEELMMNRLKKLRIENGKTQKDLATFLGITDVAYYYYETEKRDMPPETILKIADYYGVTTDYILGKENDNTTNTLYYMCPVYGKISAGIPNWAEECIEGRLPIDPELMGIINPEEHYFLRVNGESMNKIIKNGAYALIHKQDIVDDGDIAVVLVNDDEATLKKFSLQGDFIVLMPESHDNSFKQQIYTKSDNIKVIGKYVGKMEFNS